MQITLNAPEEGANAKLGPNQKNEMYVSASYLTNETPLDSKKDLYGPIQTINTN